VECSFLFQRYKNYRNRPRNARVVVENNVASFFPDTVYNVVIMLCTVHMYPIRVPVLVALKHRHILEVLLIGVIVVGVYDYILSVDV